MTHCIGLISDTHGLLRPEALAVLRGCELILHAGDVGQPFVLDELRALAPVIAVRGNVDRIAPLDRLPFTETVEVAGRYLPKGTKDSEGITWVEEPTLAHDFIGHARITREARTALKRLDQVDRR